MKAITFLKVILITAITFVTFGANAETTLEKIKRTGKVTVGTEAAFPPFEFVENGKIGAPVKGATLIGNGPDAMSKITMIGNDTQLDSGIGTCGKAGQSVPVGVGQPTVKMGGVTVGGTEAA